MHDIEGFKTPLPPLEEQREIVDQIETETNRLWELTERVDETIELLEEKRQALITAAVTGQIDVSDVKNEAKASHT
jgi:restriction endonuclease S subunit